jgi:hypothetical protein
MYISLKLFVKTKKLTIKIMVCKELMFSSCIFYRLRKLHTKKLYKQNFDDIIELVSDYQDQKKISSPQNRDHLANSYYPSKAKFDKFDRHLNLKQKHPLLFE